MYSPLKALVYPLKTSLMAVLAVVHAAYTRPKRA